MINQQKREAILFYKDGVRILISRPVKSKKKNSKSNRLKFTDVLLCPVSKVYKMARGKYPQESQYDDLE